MKKYLLPLFLLLSATVGVTSCSDDDDKSASISIAINGKAVENNGVYKLAKTTVNPKIQESELINLSLNSDCDITSVQISVSNKWEDNVDVVSNDTISHNKFHKEKNPSQIKTISFAGVIGTYTVKIQTTNGAVNYKFSVKDQDDNAEYIGNGRYLCNKQLVIFDATGDTHSKTILGETFIVDKSANTKYLNGNMCEITEEKYNEYSSDYGKGDFESVAEKCTWSKKYNMNTIPGYFVYKNSDKYYLMKVISIDGNIMIAEVQY